MTGDIVYLGYVSPRDGDVIQMLELAAGMAARGARVKAVVAADADADALHERYRARGVIVERSPWLRPGHRRQNLVEVLRLLRAQRAPIVHLHSGLICPPLAVQIALDLLRPPRAFATIQYAYGEAMRPGGRRARYWSRVAARRFQALICPSRHGARTQIGYGIPEERVRVIPNSVDTARFSRGDASVARKLLGVSDDVPLIVCTARLEPQKRPLDAVAAFARIAPEFPDARLVFVGAGSLEQAVREKAAASGFGDRIRLVGYQANIPDWLAAATAWLLPTEAENFSLGVLEALAAGCAVVSTLCRGNDEVLVPEKNAWTAAVGDIEGLAGGLRRLLGDPALRARLSAGARRTARDFALERVVEEHAACYNECVDGGS